MPPIPTHVNGATIPPMLPVAVTSTELTQLNAIANAVGTPSPAQMAVALKILAKALPKLDSAIRVRQSSRTDG